MDDGLKHPELFQNGYHLTSFPIPSLVVTLVEEENWEAVDAEFKTLTSPSGELFQFLQRYHSFQSIEFILSIRDALNEWEEDGIWHDDGSRMFSFSLSLTVNKIEGGQLAIKNKTEMHYPLLSTPAFGEIILFLTGAYGFEHKIHEVTQGKRVIIAGWCT